MYILFYSKQTMKAYTIIRDIIFFILWLGILWVGIYTAKMTDVIDSNLVYVNRKIPKDNIKKQDKIEKHIEEQEAEKKGFFARLFGKKK